MQNSIKEELTQHIKDYISDGVLTLENTDEWCHLAFNADYYIVYYSEADKWLAKHGINPFHAISECIQYENDNFGECDASKYDNSESTVNMLAHIYGEELLSDIKDDLIETMETLRDKEEEYKEHYDDMTDKEIEELDIEIQELKEELE